MSKQIAGFWVFILIVILGAAAYRFSSGLSGGGLSMGNVSSKNGTVRFIVSNNSPRNGDVVVWIDQNGKELCERVFPIAKNARVEIAFKCDTLDIGPMNIEMGWAFAYSSKASTARRIQITQKT